ncbi:MAG: threonine/serine exporter family protein [Lachnospiraceae bacterium]|nr:threonine/serine exporter family protein [Lachnospiraceae bacterium]
MTWHDVLLQFAVSYLATVGFSLVFQIPYKYLPVSGLPGALGWITYVLLEPVTGLTVSMLAGAVVLTVAARIISVIVLCPQTAFLVSGIVPLVPGSGVFLFVFYLVRQEFRPALMKGLDVILTCGAILIGISIVSAIPQEWFNRLKRKKA